MVPYVTWTTCDVCTIITIMTCVCLISAYLCWRRGLHVSRSERYVALKIVKSAKHYTETALDEIELLRKVSHREMTSSLIEDLLCVSSNLVLLLWSIDINYSWLPGEKIVSTCVHIMDSVLISTFILSSVQVASANPSSAGWNYVVQMFDHFKLVGPNGTRILYAL